MDPRVKPAGDGQRDGSTSSEHALGHLSSEGDRADGNPDAAARRDRGGRQDYYLVQSDRRSRQAWPQSVRDRDRQGIHGGSGDRGGRACRNSRRSPRSGAGPGDRRGPFWSGGGGGGAGPRDGGGASA